MAFVYWIHLKEHDDILTQGYVGITSKTVDKRFKSHLSTVNSKSKNKPKSTVHWRIRENLHNIVVTTVCECDFEYAQYLENKLRPEYGIGWNVAVGGARSGMLGKNQSSRQKKAAGDASRGVLRDTSLVGKLSKINKTRVRSDAEIKRRSEAIFEKHLLDIYHTNLDVLSRINDIYACYKRGHRLYKTSTTIGIPYAGMRALFHRFEADYDPLTDERMQEFVVNYQEKYGTYVTGKETDEKVKSAGYICDNIHKNHRGNIIAYKTVDGVQYRKEFNSTRLSETVAIALAVEFISSLMDNVA